jgi:K+-transporting ATPase ATPase A chain
MHDSYTPLGGLVPMVMIQLGEVVYGGVGSGLYGMLLFVVVAAFVAGLMVGRTPEYLGKKIESKEVKMAMLALIATAFAILSFSGISSVYGPAVGAVGNGGPHGFSEILYAFSSSAGNNGSAFAGLGANTHWYNLTLGLSMLVGRFLYIIPLLAAAGSLAAKKRVAVTSGTFPTHGPLFVGLLIGTVVIVGALTFFPALSLSPIVEHFLMRQGRVF